MVNHVFPFYGRILFRLTLSAYSSIPKWKPCVGDIIVWQNLSAADVYLAGTVMLIFGMGLYGLFISNVSPDVPTSVDRALKGSSLFGMFALKVILIPFEQSYSSLQFSSQNIFSICMPDMSQGIPSHTFSCFPAQSRTDQLTLIAIY